VNGPPVAAVAATAATGLAVPLLVASGLLVAAGLAKLVAPHDTARALRRAGLPVGPASVRVGAGAEVFIGAVGVTVGGPAAALAVAGSYLLFAAFVGAALRRGWALATCGCFGEPDTPPTVAHVVIDLGLAGAAVAASAVGGPSPAGLVARQPAAGLVGWVVAAVTGGLLYLVMSPRQRLIRELPR